MNQGAINVLDDDINTFWETEEANLKDDPAYIQFDLNNIYKLDELRLTPRQYENGSDLYKDRPLNYNIYTSDDGEIFNKVIDNGEITYGDFNDNSAKTIDLDSIVTRYIKLEITSTTRKRIYYGVELSCVGIGEIDFIVSEDVDNSNDSNEAIIKDLTKAINNNYTTFRKK